MLGEVNIRRRIFQGDSLSSLLFIITIILLTRMLRQCDTGYQLGDGHIKINHLLIIHDLKLYGRNDREIESLVHTVGIFSEDNGMQYGIEKCATIKLQDGKIKHTEDIVLPNAHVIREVKEDGYKYLGVLETDPIKNNEMKDKVKMEYLRRVRKVLQSKLNGGNMISAISTWIFNYRIQQHTDIDDMQFGFMKGKGTTDATLIARQMQEKFRAKGKKPTLTLWIWKKLLMGF